MAKIPQATEQSAPQESRDKAQLKLVVRNTFLDVVDDLPNAGAMKRSKSDSDISSSLSESESSTKSQLKVVDCQPTFGSNHVIFSNSESDTSSYSGSAPEAEAITSSRTRCAEAGTPATVLSNTPLPSLGSAMHPDQCKPCSFLQKSKCNFGVHCQHCHYPHEMKARPGKKHRDLAKARLATKGHAQTPSGSSHSGPPGDFRIPLGTTHDGAGIQGLRGVDQQDSKRSIIRL